MKYLTLLCCLMGAPAAVLQSSAQTTFTYQGRLMDGSQPANGAYDLQFRLADAVTGGNYLGPTLTNALAPVANGLFTVALDFGGSVFDGSGRWLEIGVRTNGGANFTVLAPRQPLTATPYATYAGNAASLSGTLSAAQLTGVLAVGQLPSYVLTNGASGVNLNGSFTGNGAGLTNLAITNTTLVACVDNTNELWWSGLASQFVSPVDINTHLDMSQYNGRWQWSGVDYTNGTDGHIRYYDVIDGVDVQQWYFTNALSTDIMYVGPVLQSQPSKLAPTTQADWLDLSGHTSPTALACVYGTNRVMTNFPGDTLLASVAGLATTLNTDFSNTMVSISTLSSALNAPLTNSAQVMTNMPAPGWIWSQMPVPALMLSTYPGHGCNNYESNTLAEILTAKTNGMWDAGWRYFLLEDGQYASQRDAQGNLVADPVRYPDGFNFVTTVAHANGFKIGGYSSGAPSSCCPWHNPGSPINLLWQHVAQHVQWGFDGMIIDSCGETPTVSLIQQKLRIFNQAAFNANADTRGWGVTNRGMFLIINQNDGNGAYPGGFIPWESVYEANVMGAASSPVRSGFISNYVYIARQNVQFYGMLTGPGHFAQLSSWQFPPAYLPQWFDTAIMAVSPIQAPSDPRHIGAADWQYLTNTEAISLLQDPAVLPSYIPYTNNLTEVWVRPLGAPGVGSNCVFVVNNTPTSADITVTAPMLMQSSNAMLSVRDPWAHVTFSNFNGGFTATVPPTNAVLFTTFPAIGPVAVALGPNPSLWTNNMTVPVLATIGGTTPGSVSAIDVNGVQVSGSTVPFQVALLPGDWVSITNTAVPSFTWKRSR